MDDPRRRFLIRALAAGLFAAGGGAAAQWYGRVPKKMEPGRSVYTLEGEVEVNGKGADDATAVGPNDTVEVAADGRAIFVVGQDAFLLRGGGKVKLEGAEEGWAVETLRVLAGGLLSVFGKTRHRVLTPVATIGIRGTGVYVEAEAERSYVCTCYGATELSAIGDAASREAIVSRHHDAPRYILGDGEAGKRIVAAPFKNHTDLELMLLEELVGRTPPFSVSGVDYGAPRRGY